ncbi:MAG: hypothetical protein ACD_81C00210G0007 [uncultured bacterium]|uniref:Amino acid/amide ABC transporter ATP-binding protein 2, HAAT family n=1 Tax=Candidatus Wolfebacteria bacterium GW2011_GWC2_39_22 TaxID=1619013 RepID=A0A0G0NHJ7_9BACT|nr:MAG: hypothetical protein ACD_81C00210G0007 [uncultured bacterium]KKR12286.1 MAG: Amino acid/amide ABC transporter ATP-binding protein 2, HAAT family [Candidatus Wolfebacteria bacterium GW2011_GWC2_39_22]HBI25917.1 ABC transporter ATP-binding protein [Candidatus Wolfebacteria bacterium]
MHQDSLIQLKNASVRYGGVHALEDVDVHIDAGEVVVVMGPNGAGKSTVLKALYGIEPLTKGSVVYEGTQIQPKPHEMIKRGVVFVPQGRRVFPSLTVRENIEIGGVVAGKKGLELKKKIDEVVDLFPALKNKLGRSSGILSGGEQQMVALARGLMADPKILLLDEPSLGLAPKIVKEVFEKIAEINKTKGLAVVIVEHNIKSILAVAHRAYVLDKGRVAAEGDAKEIAGSDILERVFLGKEAKEERAA